MSRAREAHSAFHTMCSGLPLEATIYYAGHMSQEYPDRSLWIGYTGDPEGAMLSATSDQAWAGLGANKRNEVITFPCCLSVQRGGEEFDGLADEAYAMLEQISDAVQADPSLGMAPPFPTTAGIIRQEFYLYPNTRGFEARIVFTVRVDTRI